MDITPCSLKYVYSSKILDEHSTFLCIVTEKNRKIFYLQIIVLGFAESLHHGKQKTQTKLYCQTIVLEATRLL